MATKKYRLLQTPTDLIEPNIPANSLEIMQKRHLLKDEKGKLLERPRDMFWRVASAISNEDEKYIKGTPERKKRAVERSKREFYNTLAENRFLPGSRVLFEAGNPIDGTGQLSSCFVLPIEDNLEAIFETMKDAAVVQKNNGGTGFNFSHIRPKNDVVGGTPNVAAGPVHFIKTFSQAFDQVLQGKKRGGGNMAILNINHPDIIEFINLKGTDSQIRNFNISVGITDQFMQAVKNDEEYSLINPRNNQLVKKLRAREVFDLICQKAWECADPGLFFLDIAQEANPTKPLGIIEATNPCGEEPLRSYESCNLGSVVMPTHLKQSKKGYEIDWYKLKQTVYTATHFLDNMIDLSKFPLKKIQEQVDATRKLGLGVVGLGTMFYQMGIAYNSQTAVDLTYKITKFIQEAAEEESSRLARERGVFPGFKGSKWDLMGKKVRNATMSSIAPTGTLSLVADVSSGIEPIFSLVYERRSFYQDEGKEERKSLLYVDKVFEKYAKENGFYSIELMKKIADNNGRLAGIDEVPENAKKIFVTTHDIEPNWHVAMQAASQANVDAAVSKTINLHHNATVDDIKKAYIQAWEGKCKGITIYRDGSKQFQVLETVSSKKDETTKPTSIKFKADFKPSDFLLTPNAVQVLEKRALLKDSKGQITETTSELWHRIAKKIASAEQPQVQEKVEEEFYQAMQNGEFFCGGSLIWAGLGEEAIFSKCLVLPIQDSIDSIFQTLEWNVQCLRRGVGTGFNFSTIRSTYSTVGSTGEQAAGPLEYLRMFNRAQDTLRGRGGRGLGSMAILNADHPNIEDFISCKDDLAAITHYNISVGASDSFMQAVKNNLDWQLIDPHDHKAYKTVNARELFEKIAKHAWLSGDPGMYFLDTAEKGNSTPTLGNMSATNPCGEQPLIPFETCNMGHINLAQMVEGFPFLDIKDLNQQSLEDKFQYINWDKIAAVTATAVRFLDNIIDVNNYPVKEIEEMSKKTRNIGVGVMGFADLLVKLGIVYGSEQSLQVAEKLMSFIQTAAHNASEALGIEKGSFPAFGISNWVKSGKKHMRNVRITTIAPTGTISIIGNCNPGIEPIFALGYRRKNSMGGVDQLVIEHLFEQVAKEKGFYSEELQAEIADGKDLSSLASKYQIDEEVVNIFRTTHQINPEEHVRIQAVFQKYVDSAVSKTINLPHTASWEDIARVYMLAYDLGCKGITVFRDGSKDPALQVGTGDKKDPAKVNEPVQMVQTVRNSLEPRARQDVIKGKTYNVKTEQGSLYVTVNEDDKGIFEVFLNLGKSGSYTAGYTQAIGRLVSMALRSGIKPESVIDQLQGIRTSAPTMNRGMIVYSVPDAVAKILKKHMEESRNQMQLLSDQEMEVQPVVDIKQIEIEEKKLEQMVEDIMQQSEEYKEETVVVSSQVLQSATAEVSQTTTSTVEEDYLSHYTKDNKFGDLLECPDCSGDLEYAEGCILCRSCGFSKCG